MNFSSRYASSFLKCFPNLDLTKNVKIMPWEMNDKQDATKNNRHHLLSGWRQRVDERLGHTQRIIQWSAANGKSEGKRPRGMGWFRNDGVLIFKRSLKIKQRRGGAILAIFYNSRQSDNIRWRSFYGDGKLPPRYNRSGSLPKITWILPSGWKRSAIMPTQ